MRALLDTNVVIDFLEARAPFAEPARNLFSLAAQDAFEACIAAKEATDIYYITARELHSKQKARELLVKLVRLTCVLDTTSADVYHSLLENHSDFEDGVMIATATREGLDAIITRDGKGYERSSVPVFSPTAFAETLA